MAHAKRRPSLLDAKTFGSSAELLKIGIEPSRHQKTLLSHVADATRTNEIFRKKVAGMRLRNLDIMARVEQQRIASNRVSTHINLALTHTAKAFNQLMAAACQGTVDTMNDIVEFVPPLRCVQRGCEQPGAWLRACVGHVDSAPKLPPSRLSRRVKLGAEVPAQQQEERRLKAERAATFVPEDRWDQGGEHGVWFPVQPSKQKWDMFVLVIIMYSCIIVPFRIGMRWVSRRPPHAHPRGTVLAIRVAQCSRKGGGAHAAE